MSHEVHRRDPHTKRGYYSDRVGAEVHHAWKGTGDSSITHAEQECGHMGRHYIGVVEVQYLTHIEKRAQITI